VARIERRPDSRASCSPTKCSMSCRFVCSPGAAAVLSSAGSGCRTGVLCSSSARRRRVAGRGRGNRARRRNSACRLWLGDRFRGARLDGLGGRLAATRRCLLAVDYGFPRREYYHPQRLMGTIMCHYRHRAHADPFWWPGLNDLTAHGDFSSLAAAAQGAGLDVLGYTSQAHFLLNCGLIDRLGERHVPRAAPLSTSSCPRPKWGNCSRCSPWVAASKSRWSASRAGTACIAYRLRDR